MKKLALLALLLCSIPTAQADVVDRIRGGAWFDPSGTGMAWLISDSGSCSGLLVGSNVVLTAAHCICSLQPTGSVTGVVGGKAYKTAETWRSGAYPCGAPAIDLYSQFDIGVYILASPVTNVPNERVLYGNPLKKGALLYVFGFGATEFPGMSGYTYGKVAAMKVSVAKYGVIKTKEASSGATTCSGDSGGPAFMVLDDLAGVTGLVSIGTSMNYYGMCVSRAGGSQSTLLNLQSAASPTVQWMDARSMVAFVSARAIYLELTQALQTGDKRTICKVQKSAQKLIKLVFKNPPEPTRFALLSNAPVLRRAHVQETLQRRHRTLSRRSSILTRC